MRIRRSYGRDEDNRMNKNIQILCLAIIVLILPVFSSVYAQAVIQGKLEAVKTEISFKDRAEVKFILTNNSKEPVRVLTWMTPLDSLASDAFVVTKDNEPVKYIGLLVKRGKPKEKDYITIQPGKTFNKVIDLSSKYAIDEAGEYRIQLRREKLIIIPQKYFSSLTEEEKSDFLVSLYVEPVIINLSGDRNVSKLLTNKNALTEQATLQSCTEDQEDILEQATSVARSISSISFNALQKETTDQLYTVWFGTGTGSVQLSSYILNFFVDY